MNDNDIIKALEKECEPSEINCVHGQYIEACGIYCSKFRAKAEGCDNCKEHDMGYYGKRAKATLALINRQKTEIEKYELVNKEKFNNWMRLEERTKERYAELYEEAKSVVRAEAIKEFAERLKDYVIPQKRDGYTAYIVPAMSIDNLVKEMTEGEND